MDEDTLEDFQELLHSVTTIEVVDQSPDGDGRCYEFGPDAQLEVMVDLTNDGRTLKVFIR